MFDYTTEQKREIIADILKDIDFRKDYSVKRIESQIHQRIGEKVAIQIDRVARTKINEATGAQVRVEKLNSVKIFFPGSEPTSIKKIEIFV